MIDEIKSWLIDRYSSYPIPIGAILSEVEIEVITGNSTSTIVETGKISVGVGQSRSKIEYYSSLIHEFRHAIAAYWANNAPEGTKVVIDMGLSREGAGIASEELLLPIFLKEQLNDALAINLYKLSFASRDARIMGTTAATLERFFRQKCDDATDLDTIEYSKSIAIAHGISGNLVDTASLRSHAGTDYLQYVWGGLQMLDELEILQQKILPNREKLLDPYVLFLCGQNTPKFDNTYIEKLRSCLMH